MDNLPRRSDERPYRVILLDEIEKAHPDVFSALLQILDDGRLTDGQGRTVDFKNTIIIMTSNAGVELIRKDAGLGFATKKEDAKSRHQRYEEMKEKVLGEVKRMFRPEFLNRLDDIIVFHELNEEQIRSIVDLMIKGLQKQLEERKLIIELAEAAKAWLAKTGFDPIYGARPLRRAIERYVENPLSSMLLRGEAKAGDTIVIDLKEDALTFSTNNSKSGKKTKSSVK